jgi:hypothetical protein
MFWSFPFAAVVLIAIAWQEFLALRRGNTSAA